MTHPPIPTDRRADAQAPTAPVPRNGHGGNRSASRRRSGFRAGATAAAAFAALLFSACGEPAPAPEAPITREQFIEAVVALRNAERAVADMDSADARFESRRDSILESLSLTEADLRGFLDAHHDLGYMEAVWDSVTQRLKRPLDEMGARGRGRFRDGPEDER